MARGCWLAGLLLLAWCIVGAAAAGCVVGWLMVCVTWQCTRLRAGWHAYASRRCGRGRCATAACLCGSSASPRGCSSRQLHSQTQSVCACMHTQQAASQHSQLPHSDTDATRSRLGGGQVERDTTSKAKQTCIQAVHYAQGDDTKDTSTQLLMSSSDSSSESMITTLLLLPSAGCCCCC